MSYRAAILCLHMDSFHAFRAMVSLMSTRLLFDMYRLEQDRVLFDGYISILRTAIYIYIYNIYVILSISYVKMSVHIDVSVLECL
jgi:hypothetical protein